MLYLCMNAESKKLRHSVIWLAALLIPIIPAIMGTFNYVQNVDVLTGGWYSLWEQYTLFYSMFFYAPLIGLYCAYLWRLEHTNHNWNVLMTMPVSIIDIFIGKLCIILMVTLFTQLWVYFLFFLGGKCIGLSGFAPIDTLFWALRGTFAAIVIGTLQLLLSMCIRNFAIPIGIALAGGCVGLILSNLGLGLYWPYSLLMMGMNSNSYEDKMKGDVLPFLISTLLFFLLFFSISIILLKKKDVKT